MTVTIEHLQPETTVPPGASSLHPSVAGKEALRKVRKLARGLPEPERSEALVGLSVLSRSIPSPKRPKRDKKDADLMKAVKSIMGAVAKRVGGSDWDADLLDRADVVAFCEEQLAVAVRMRQASGRHSWPSIGRTFGLSHQGAMKRWAK